MKRLAVLGRPVAHSRSPAMQTAALAATGLGDDWSYGAIEVSAQDFPAKVTALAGEGYVGANVTIPHKEAALLLAAQASERARQIGAANTLSFTDAGIVAENTDATAIAELTAEAEPGPALVLGAGGSARAAAWALREAGREVSIWNRSSGRAEGLARDLGIAIAPSSFEPAEFAVIVNATPVGLDAEPGDEQAEGDKSSVRGALKGLPISADGLTDRQVVVDLAYGSVETPVIAAARAAGARWVDGLEMLVRQGAESFRIWTGIDPPLDVMRRAARAGDSDDERTRDTSSPGPGPGG